MRNRLLTIFTTWPFILALAILLLNDWWLKSAYSGVVTGKLSDFAGLAVVAILLLAAFPYRASAVYVAVSVSFLWWKSPLSEPFIQFVNEWAPWTIGRTVDYTDLIALSILPACRRMVALSTRYSLPWLSVRKFLTIPVIAASLLGVMGTSVIPARQEYVVRQSDTSIELRRNEVSEVISNVAASIGLVCVNCAHTTEFRKYHWKGITMTYSFPTKNSVLFAIEVFPNGLFSGPDYESADALRNSLKAHLADRFQGLEYVEQLTYSQGKRP